MFHLNIGTTPCQLSQADYRALGDRTEGYSGSDLAVVVRDALMQPVRKVLSATHFKEVRPTSLSLSPSWRLHVRGVLTPPRARVVPAAD